ncbi:MAG: outer membrane beta-barrel protein [Planctomycetota bacterium]
MNRSLRLAVCIAALAMIGAQKASGRSGVDTGMPWNVHYDRPDTGDTPWSVFRDDLPIEIGGWMSGGFTVNASGNRTGNGNAPLSVNNVADTPLLNQLWFYAAKPLDMETHELDWGFRVDYVFGADGPDNQASGDEGWDFGWNTSRDYGSAIPQIYAEFGWRKTVLRIGYKFGLQGYEAGQAVDTFFYSHNYAFGYAVPGTHAGAAVTHSLTDQLDIVAGWTMGWDSWWSNYISASTFVGGFTWNLTNTTSITYHVTAGDFGDGTAKNGVRSNNGDLYAHAIVLTHRFSDRFDWAIENTLGNNTGLGTDDNQWYSLTTYLFFDINDSWAVGSRFEWFRDDDGKRVNVNGAGAGSYYDATLGVNWYPNANLAIRPEVRWDWFDGQGRPFDSRNGGMSGTEVHQFTGGLDFVLIF